jgi:hypothetical protein
MEFLHFLVPFFAGAAGFLTAGVAFFATGLVVRFAGVFAAGFRAGAFGDAFLIVAMMIFSLPYCPYQY